MAQVQEIRAVKVGTGLWVMLAAICAVVSFACVAIPMYVIRPFRPQGAEALIELSHGGAGGLTDIAIGFVVAVLARVSGWAS